uniref:AMP-dependent synthetase/ligase domain-containing protein n=1 Tax=Aegilops tauschii subsp. strangulata TaxID=200361 RepID=A0A453LXS9_AEGTS
MDKTAYTVKVGEATPAAGGRPAAGPVYRSIYAKDGLMRLPQEIHSPWDFFRVEQSRSIPRTECSDGARFLMARLVTMCGKRMNKCTRRLSRLEQLSEASALSRGAHCAIYGSNCPEWVMAMQACNSQGICYVPLYD